MKINTHMQKIDVDKLRKYLKDNKITQITLSEKIGKAPNYIRHCLEKKVMSITSYKLMCLTLGVDESTFVQHEEQKKMTNEAIIGAIKEINKQLEFLTKEIEEFWKDRSTEK